MYDPHEDRRGGRSQSDPQPRTNSKTNTAPKSSERPRAGEEGAATSANPEASNTTADELQGASVLDEHHILMGTVFEKIQSNKSGQNEAFSSLLAGFEVRNVMFLVIL